MLPSIVVGAFFIIANNKADPEETSEFITREEKTVESSSYQETLQDIFIDIKGAVKNPGVYEVKKNIRVWDVIILAGGLLEDADGDQVNFSERVMDQMVISIPHKGEEKQEMETTQEKKALSDNQKINLNSATEVQLMELTGIGQKKAQEIIRYREENGGFKTIEEIKQIAGIGEKTFEKIAEQLCV